MRTGSPHVSFNGLLDQLLKVGKCAHDHDEGRTPNDNHCGWNCEKDAPHRYLDRHQIRLFFGFHHALVAHFARINSQRLSDADTILIRLFEHSRKRALISLTPKRSAKS